jgi:hypothetical protein
VTGTFEGADASWVHLRRAANRPPIRLHRGSVARVEVTDGRQYPVGKRMAQGLAVGAVIGAGLMSDAFLAAARCHGGDCEMALGIGVIAVGLSGAVGAGVGAVVGLGGEDGWRELPLDSLGPLPTEDAATSE